MDAIRSDDLRAAGDRDALRVSSGSNEDYLRSLEARLTFHVGADAHIARKAELARQTNQWNRALRRVNETEIAQRIAEHPRNSVAFWRSDKHSDSGVTGAGRRRDGVIAMDGHGTYAAALRKRTFQERGTIWCTEEDGLGGGAGESIGGTQFRRRQFVRFDCIHAETFAIAPSRQHDTRARRQGPCRACLRNPEYSRRSDCCRVRKACTVSITLV